jgi:molybdopterin-guanine dinucleotide biosynthesis protein A
MTAPVPGVAGAILAGGQASRMGGHAKSFLEVGGRRVIDRQLEVLGPLFAELLVVANDPAPYAPLGLPVVPDEIAGQGPLVGILAAVESARAPAVVVVACDMPFLTDAALRHIATTSPDADVVVPVVAGRPEPLCARYGRACAPAIRRAVVAGERGVTRFLAGAREHLRVHELGEAELRAIDPALAFLGNCNTPEELARAREARR